MEPVESEILSTPSHSGEHAVLVDERDVASVPESEVSGDLNVPADSGNNGCQ
jgi:hypothetical protein